MPNKAVNISTFNKNTIFFAEQNQIFDTLKSRLSPRDTVLVTVSGGPDSMLSAILIYNFFVLQKYDLQKLYFIHCHHGLRTESDQEAKFFNSFFAGTNKILVKKSKGSKANEEALRERRYGQFNKQIIKHKISHIVFGHNLTDRIESSFLNMLRGSGLQGFLSMSQVASHHLIQAQIIRPLLTLSKDHITDICKLNKIPFFQDKTNKNNNISLRNYIRNKVLKPLYAKSHKKSNSSNTFLDSMQNIYSEIESMRANQLLSPANTNGSAILSPIKASPFWKSKQSYKLSINRDFLSADILISIFKQLKIYKNISQKLIQERIVFLQKKNEGYKYFRGCYCFISHGEIYFIQAPEKFWQTQPHKTIKINKLDIYNLDDIQIKVSKPDLIGCSIRYPKAGDTYKGKNRNKRCINAKIPMIWRNFIPIIVKDKEIKEVVKGKWNR